MVPALPEGPPDLLHSHTWLQVLWATDTIHPGPQLTGHGLCVPQPHREEPSDLEPEVAPAGSAQPTGHRVMPWGEGQLMAGWWGVL